MVSVELGVTCAPFTTPTKPPHTQTFCLLDGCMSRQVEVLEKVDGSLQAWFPEVMRV